MAIRVWVFGACTLLFTSACMGRGAAGRAAALPQPTDLGTWLAIAVFVIGIWWAALKILRG